MIWSTAGRMKSWNWISAIGRMPFIAAPIATPDDQRFGERAVEHAPLAELLLQPLGDAEHAALGADVLTEDHHALVALHLLADAVADRLDVRLDGHGQSPGLGVHVEHRRVGGGQRRRLGLVGRAIQLEHQLGAHLLGVAGVQHAELLEGRLEAEQRIPLLLGLELLGLLR